MGYAADEPEGAALDTPLHRGGYRYYFVPYLLADDDTLTIQEAFEQSAAMTDNRKFDLFVYDLSFVGWAFLVVLTAGIAAFFVAPYIEASRIQLYKELRG